MNRRVRKSPLSPHSLHGNQVAEMLRGLADLAEQGKVVGVAAVAWTSDKKHKKYVAGVLRASIPLAHYVTCKLKDALLYPDEEE